MHWSWRGGWGCWRGSWVRSERFSLHADVLATATQSINLELKFFQPHLLFGLAIFQAMHTFKISPN